MDLLPPDASRTEIDERNACGNVGHLPFKERCEYVKQNVECAEHTLFVSYLELLYCSVGPSNNIEQALCLFIFFGMVVLCFFILALVADDILCPALQMLTVCMGMGEHIAGVTLVAFGNSAPDFFSSLASLNDQTREVYSDLLASSIFVICFVSGLIILINPFRLHPFCILRDTCFLMLGILMIDHFVSSKGTINVTESVLIILMYAVYILVVALDQYILQRTLRKLQSEKFRTVGYYDDDERLGNMRTEAFLDVHPRPSSVGRISRFSSVLPNRSTLSVIDIEDTRESNYGNTESKNKGLFTQFVETLNPFDKDEWEESRCFNKALIVFRVPFVITFNILIPKVNYEQSGHGWSKLLNSIQIFLMPYAVCIMIFKQTVFGQPIAIYTLPITIPAGIVVFMITSTMYPPKFHWLFAAYSAVGAIVAIYILAGEISEILFVSGFAMHCSQSFLAATVLAWGNGIGDLVSNIALSQQGYQRMGFAACYGSPIFNIFFSMGFSFCYKTVTSETQTIKVERGIFGQTCFIFLFITALLTFVWAPFTNFCARRIIGVLLTFTYSLFFLFCMLTEVNIMHSYSKPTFQRML